MRTVLAATSMSTFACASTSLTAFVMTPANHQRKTRDWNGLQRDYYAIPFENRYIWGITAGILRNLYERIYAG